MHRARITVCAETNENAKAEGDVCLVWHFVWRRVHCQWHGVFRRTECSAHQWVHSDGTGGKWRRGFVCAKRIQTRRREKLEVVSQTT